MTIILFLVDSSASMAQRNYMGCAFIDTAKSIVQDIVKLRQRDFNTRQSDRYMLFSTEEFPECVKAGWKESSGVFHEQLKALRPCGKAPLQQTLLAALRFVNLNRAQTGVDYYGHGRFPHLLESVIVVTISDGQGVGDLPSDFELRADPKHPFPGSEYTEEGFRWDQRVFSVVLRMGAQYPPEPRIGTPLPVNVEPGVIQRVCAATGGRSFTVISHKQQTAVVEVLTQMIHVNGIVVRFEVSTPGLIPRNGAIEIGEPSEEKLRKALEEHPITFVLTRNRAPAHWPIPEAFWPDAVQNNPKMPVRKAHPMLTIGINPSEAQVNTDFPFDKYELDPVCALADYVRERTAAIGNGNGNVCWQVFVFNSYRSAGVGKPFGFLKTATNGTSVNLFLMPYNYPVLLSLLSEQKNDVRARASAEWRNRLEQYVVTCPSYYKQQLKKALMRLKLSCGKLDEPPSNLYAPQLNKALTNMKSVGKAEMEKLIAEIGAKLSKPPQPPSYCVPVERHQPTQQLKNFRIEWEENRRVKLAVGKSDEHQEKKRVRGSRLPMPARNNAVVIEDDIGSDPEAPEPPPLPYETVPNMMRKLKIELYALPSTGHVYRNPFSIARNQLVQMLPRHRANLEQHLRDSPIPALEGGLPGMNCKLQNAYELHSLPSIMMGNYDEYVKSLEAIGGGPLREVEHRAVRENTFGNPFKKDKKNLAVDEVGEAPAAARETNGMSKKDRRAMESNRPPRRKPGPLPLNAMQTWRERRRTNSMSSTVSDLSHTADDLADDITQAETSDSSSSLNSVEDMASDLAALWPPSDNGAAPSHSAPSVAAVDAVSNGAAAQRPASPAESAASMDSGVSVWGLDDDNEIGDLVIIEDDEEEKMEPSPAKKAKLALPSAVGASRSAPSVLASTSASALVVPPGRKKKRREELTLEGLRYLKGEVCRVVRMFLSDEAMLAKIDSLLAPLSTSGLVMMTRFARDEVTRFKKRALTTTLQQRLNKLETVVLD